MGLGWFGYSTFWLLPLLWRMAARLLAGERPLTGPGTLRVWLGTALVLCASASLEALTAGAGRARDDGAALAAAAEATIPSASTSASTEAGGGAGHALATLSAELFGWTGALLVMLGVLALAAPMVFGETWGTLFGRRPGRRPLAAAQDEGSAGAVFGAEDERREHDRKPGQGRGAASPAAASATRWTRLDGHGASSATGANWSGSARHRGIEPVSSRTRTPWQPPARTSAPPPQPGEIWTRPVAPPPGPMAAPAQKAPLRPAGAPAAPVATTRPTHAVTSPRPAGTAAPVPRHGAPAPGAGIAARHANPATPATATAAAGRPAPLRATIVSSPFRQPQLGLQQTARTAAGSAAVAGSAASVAGNAVANSNPSVANTHPGGNTGADAATAQTSPAPGSLADRPDAVSPQPHTAAATAVPTPTAAATSMELASAPSVAPDTAGSEASAADGPASHWRADGDGAGGPRTVDYAALRAEAETLLDELRTLAQRRQWPPEHAAPMVAPADPATDAREDHFGGADGVPRVDSADSTESFAATVSTDSVDSIETTDRTDRIDSLQRIDSADSAASVDSAQRIDSADRAASVDSAERIDSAGGEATIDSTEAGLEAAIRDRTAPVAMPVRPLAVPLPEPEPVPEADIDADAASASQSLRQPESESEDEPAPWTAPEAGRQNESEPAQPAQPEPQPIQAAAKPRIVVPAVVGRAVPLPASEPAGPGAPAATPPAPAAPIAPTPRRIVDYRLPPVALLEAADAHLEPVSEEILAQTGELIEQRLAEFKVPVAVVGASAGPVITRFEVEPAMGIRGAQVVNLMKDLARALGVSSIRVVETIPGKTCMGLELPNARREMIRLSEIVEAPLFQNHASHLVLAMGKDITGTPVVTDLARAPHLLVAGTTGSGKSVAINAMILSMLYKATPDDVRMIMIDPKMLELSVYEGIPHLLAPVVTDMKQAAHALNWCVGEMEKRYRLMSALGVRNLAGYNHKIRAAEAEERKVPNPFSLTPDAPEPLSTLPLIVVVIDELADLMMVAGKKIEELIARLAQKARAAGIHLILATQRPSVDVITGLIKANIPTRVAFQVSSKIDSRTILDQMGAESLLGQGDMLFLPPGTGYPQRVHGAFAADEEVHRVVEHWKQFGEPDYDDAILAGDPAEAAGGDLFGDGGGDAESDPLYDEAAAFVLSSRRASISAVQRHLRIGYNRAARLIEQMEVAGLVSPMGRNGARDVLAPGD